MITRRYIYALLLWTLLACVTVSGVANAGSAITVHKIGAVTWHAAKFVNHYIVLSGYLLLRGDGYVLFSDEPSGGISSHDLPVSGLGIDLVQPKVRYVITGHFVRGGLIASNGNPYHLELTAVPAQAH